MENHHFQWVNPLFLWPFSIAMLNYQRVIRWKVSQSWNDITWHNYRTIAWHVTLVMSQSWNVFKHRHGVRRKSLSRWAVCSPWSLVFDVMTSHLNHLDDEKWCGLRLEQLGGLEHEFYVLLEYMVFIWFIYVFFIYWECHFIPIDELHDFSEGLVGIPPKSDCY